MIDFLNSPKWNIRLLAAVVLISTLLILATDTAGDKVKVTLVVTWLPLLLGLATLLLYRLSRVLFKKYNWIITLLGSAYILNASIQFLFS